MNMFKKNGGFTLVELIVVIAILAILAGVAVPAYSGYISKAQEAADLQVLTAVNTAIDAATAVEQPTTITADYVNGAIVVEFDGAANADYTLFMTNNDTSLSYYSDVEYDATEGAVVGIK